MASDLDNLIKSLKRQRDDVESDMNSTREQDAAALVEKYQTLRKRSEELDETCRKRRRRIPRADFLPKSRIIRAR
jgi:hypothetical protein